MTTALKQRLKKHTGLVAVATAVLVNPSGFAEPIQKQPFHETSIIDICGKTVLSDVQATFFTKPGPLPNGDLFREVAVDYEWTFTNLDTGTSVVLKRSGVEEGLSFQPSSDGQYMIGTLWTTAAIRVVVPGSRPFISVGKIYQSYYFDAVTQELVDMKIERFNQARNDSDGDLEPYLCSVL